VTTSLLADLTAIQLDVLRAVGIAADEGHVPGTETERAFETLRPESSLSNMRRQRQALADRGYLAVRMLDGRANAYRLTDKGRDALAAHRDMTARALE
jgi:hypothetical protein